MNFGMLAGLLGLFFLAFFLLYLFGESKRKIGKLEALRLERIKAEEIQKRVQEILDRESSIVDSRSRLRRLLDKRYRKNTGK